MTRRNDMILNNILDKYNIFGENREYFVKLIDPIYNSYEFRKRLTSKFPHHGKMSLGEHILEVAVVTYKKGLKYNHKKDFKIDIAILIAMMHDLYVAPWQNNNSGNKYFANMHGFRHPVEAVINALYWYPELFRDTDDAKKMIDGILHHMYPFPVRVWDISDNMMELNNYDVVNKINDEYIDLIRDSISRGKIGRISFTRSKYLEGKIISRVDKKVSISELGNFRNMLALVTGKNKNLLSKGN